MVSKKILLILSIGIIAAIGISLTLFLNSEETSAQNSGHFNYKDTIPITQDTYLDKTVSEWQKESHDSLMAYHEIHHDQFFVDLGALVMKNEMLHVLNEQNIKVLNNDFNVHSGMMLTSLPPHVSFEAFVNSTDGDSYRLSGMTMRAKVNQPILITKLQFFDTSVKLPLESILSKNNTITIGERDNNTGPNVIHRNLILSGNNDISVNFQNIGLVPIRIQGDGDWKNPNWYGPTILPFTTESMTFDNPGIHEWHARTLPLPGTTSSDSMGRGEISIIGDNMNELSFSDRQQIGAAILQNSEIPWTGMGSGNNKGITVRFNDAILDILPNATEYYQARAEQLIPFDVPIVMKN